MSDRAPYAEVKNVVEEFVDALFKGMETSHGWTKDEFMANYREELMADMEEETYDITIQPPLTLQ